MTPALEINTPFDSHSRIGSADDLTSMAGAASGNFSANVLQSRLSNLQNRGLTRRTQDHGHASIDGGGSSRHSFHEASEDEFSLPRQNSPPHGEYFTSSGGSGSRYSNIDPFLRHPSEEERPQSGTHTPQHIEFNTEDLSRVPSYTTAMQASVRTPIRDGLPNYQRATSRPPSPILSLPQFPSQAHTHTARSSPDSTSSTATLPMRTPQLNQRLQQDEERRSRTLPARERH